MTTAPITAAEHVAAVTARLAAQGVDDPRLLTDLAHAITLDHAAVGDEQEAEAWRAREAVCLRIELALKRAKARRR